MLAPSHLRRHGSGGFRGWNGLDGAIHGIREEVKTHVIVIFQKQIVVVDSRRIKFEILKRIQRCWHMRIIFVQLHEILMFMNGVVSMRSNQIRFENAAGKQFQKRVHHWNSNFARMFNLSVNKEWNELDRTVFDGMCCDLITWWFLQTKGCRGNWNISNEGHTISMNIHRWMERDGDK